MFAVTGDDEERRRDRAGNRDLGETGEEEYESDDFFDETSEDEELLPEAPEPEEGRYYVADLLGCDIVTEGGKVLGKLKDVRQASTDVYTLFDGSRDILFPVADGVVVAVDVENGTITVNEKRFYEVAVL